MSFPKVYRSNYDFNAEDTSVELSVAEGDIVISTQPPQDMWIHVYKYTRPDAKGYVPFDYLSELPPAEAKAYLVSSTPSPRREAVPAAVSAFARASMSTNNLSSSTAGMSQSRYNAASTVPVPSGLPSADAFAQHEAQFRQVLKAREETFRKLESSLAQTADEIRQCQTRNSELNGKVRELDAMIEEERRRWKDRLDAEKKQLQTAM